MAYVVDHKKYKLYFTTKMRNKGDTNTFGHQLVFVGMSYDSRTRGYKISLSVKPRTIKAGDTISYIRNFIIPSSAPYGYYQAIVYIYKSAERGAKKLYTWYCGALHLRKE